MEKKSIRDGMILKSPKKKNIEPHIIEQIIYEHSLSDESKVKKIIEIIG